jgi:hypothetical protein
MRIAGIVLAALALAAGAWAKEFPPGSLMVCGATQCRVLSDGTKTTLLGRFLYGERRVVPAPTPRVGSPVYLLRFKNGYAGVLLTHTAARVHGLNCGRFRRGHWYRLPRELQSLGRGLKPRRLRAVVPHSC